ncbi:hypothetical protein FGL89_05305 [Leuconostoc carnosum]|uniref:Uncharacterized protein n=1 Tax=Leuconostoc carnosum TaxID=1252 RepID=A0AAE6IIS2_LEUCA|nr:hypothetical protein [Leuconostoc carnosum]QEA33579.1 hypothetical protein FGL89_05305 [Leuconostoc carnosum]
MENTKKTTLKDVNDDLRLLLEFAKGMTDYISRINDNSWAINREIVKSDYLSAEIGKSETAVTMLNKYLNKAVKLLDEVE